MKLVFSTILAFIAVANAAPVDLGFDGRNSQIVPKHMQAKMNKLRKSAFDAGMATLQKQATDLGLDVDFDKLASEVQKSLPKNQAKKEAKKWEQEFKNAASSKQAQDSKRQTVQMLNQGKAMLNKNSDKSFSDFMNMAKGFLGQQIKQIDNAEIQKAVGQAAEKGMEILEDKMPNKNMKLGNAVNAIKNKGKAYSKKNGVDLSEGGLKRAAAGKMNQIVNNLQGSLQG